MNRLAVALTLLAVVACSQGNQPPSGKAVAAGGRPASASAGDMAFGLGPADVGTTNAYETRIRQQRTFASLPDRGELLSYERGGKQDTRAEGAYIWHRAGFSEEHALRAIVDGRLRVTTPSGRMLDIRYDRHVEHPSGDFSWIGHVEGAPGTQTILTFGADAVFGSIGQPGERSLRVTTRNGAGWVVETDPAKLVGAASAGANPRKPDALAVPEARARSAGAPPAHGAQVLTTPGAAAAATTTIDLLVGYTQGFASAQGGASGVMTRMNYLVTVANEALANSQVNTRIRLVHSMQVSYTDGSANEDALEQLTGYDSENERYTTPNAAFNALRAARETYGADLVTLVRDFRDPEQQGCGIAWLIGGGRSGVTPGDGQDYFGYSVVSDGYDENGSETYYCRDETLIHELAHNMGSQHDRGAADEDDDDDGDGNQLDPDEYGAFTYSFGLKTSASAGNFYTVMAYGEEGQTDYRVFSNPRITICGGRACGGTTYEDNARSLGSVSPVIATFRRGAAAGFQHNDVDGDAHSDLLFHYTASSPGKLQYWIMDGVARERYGTTEVRGPYKVAGTGDFNGDRRLDLVWASSTRNIAMWIGNGSTFASYGVGSFGAGWALIGTGDVDGDGRSDLLFHNVTTNPGKLQYWIMNGTVRQRYGTVSVSSAFKVSATGDFNGDGRLDLLWTNAARTMVMWIGSGSGFSVHSIGSYGVGWSLVGAGDVDGDGRSDLLFRNATTNPGKFQYWIMNGAARMRFASKSVSNAYDISTTGDFNGDGRLDLVWTNASRTMVMWTGNGSTFSISVMGSYGVGWQIVR